MSAPIILTPHQCDAVSWLLEHLVDGVPLVALRGLAGVGKSTVIPALVSLLEEQGIPVSIGAPTHRAAMVLKRKGIETADTVHAHALTPYFTGDYTKALRWVGGSCQCKIEDLANAQPAVDGIPWLVAERLKITGGSPETVKARARQYDPKRALESIGITGRQHFAGFGPKNGAGVLIIDEASMVGTEMLRLCQEAFPQICLVGDPGQLPPVTDTAQLADVLGFTLTELHRQAAESPIVQLAYAAREGERFWEHIPHVPAQLEEYASVEARAFLTAPLIVWRNKTRLECTAAIRAALGYSTNGPTVGEPLVCRTTDPRARADGFYTNALFTVVATSAENPRLVTLQPDGNPDAETHEVLVHMEETDGDNIDPKALLFRWSYCLTVHTAQGGEWPTVYISKPDLFAHSKRSPEAGEADDFARWAYTAITRAKVTLGFVRKHDFTTTIPVAPIPWVLPQTGDDDMPKMKQEAKITPPSAPMLNQDPNEPDDIPEPTLPPGLADEAMAADIPGLPPEAPRTAQEPSNGTAPPVVPSTVPALPESFLPLAHGFCQYLQAQFGAKLEEAAIGMTKAMGVTMDGMTRYTQGVLQCNEHAEIQLSDALLKLHEHGLEVRGAPYEMQLQVFTPAGIPLTLTIRKTSAADLLDELTRLETWLALNNYSGEKPAEVEA